MQSIFCGACLAVQAKFIFYPNPKANPVRIANPKSACRSMAKSV